MSYSFDVLVSNSGNSSFEDEGMLSFSGMEGLVEVTFTSNGTEVNGPFVMGSPSSDPLGCAAVSRRPTPARCCRAGGR